MSTQENMAAERRLTEEVWNKHNPGAADEFLAPDVVEHNPILGLGPGREGFRQALETLFSAFPDAHITLEDLFADGDKVVERWTARATHRGEFMRIPATNKQVTVEGIDIYRYAGGKRVETWRQWDTLRLMQQLGVMPSSGQSEESLAISTQQNKQIVLRWREEIWNKRNVNIIDELHAPHFVGHYGGVVPEPIRGREALKQLFAAYLAAFDIDVTPEFLIAEGDKVVVHDTNRVKHTGAFQGIAPTGKEGTVTSTDIYRIVDGKIVEQWFESDFTGFMQKLLAIVPTPGGSGR